MGTSYFEGDSFSVDENTSRLFLDVGFNERPVAPASDVTQSAQTGDSNWILFAIIGAILLLAIAGLITYFVIKKKKESKNNTYKPKH